MDPPPPGPAPSWALDFARSDGTGGFVRLGSGPGGARWFWAYLVGPDLGLVVVRDHEVPPPGRPGSLVVRAEGLWAEFTCETPDEHWTVGLEAFGVRLDDPADGWRGEVGERLAVGLDLEWEVGPGEATADGLAGPVFGDLLVGRDRLAFEGSGVFRHDRDAAPWRTTRGVEARFGSDGLPTAVTVARAGRTAPADILATVAIPLDLGASVSGGAGPRRLVRVLLRWAGEAGESEVGWVDLVPE